MKQLSSRWVAVAVLVPVSILLAILLVGIEPPEASSTNARGFLQVILTGSLSGTSGFAGNPNVQLNVVSVRLNPSSDLGISDGDLNWQTIAVPSGATRGDTNPSLTLGGNFGPNGQAVNVGMGRSEIQIDLGQINSATIFNTGNVKAITYGQVELILDPTTPGNVVPPCGVGTSTGEGCIVYPLALNSNVSTIRSPAQITVTRKTTQQLVLNIGAQLSAGPQASNQQVLFTPIICALPVTGTNSQCPAPFNSLQASDFTALVTGTVTGGTKKTTVNAELPGTGTVVSSIGLDETAGSKNTFTMLLPVAGISSGTTCQGSLKNCSATYDIYATAQGHSLDVKQGVTVFNGPSGTNNALNFTLTKSGSKSLTGRVFDACSGAPIPGATLEIFGPSEGSVAPAPTDCNLGTGVIPATCAVFATASTDGTGSFPLPGNGTQASPFTFIPKFPKGEYALKATVSGYNGEILAVQSASNGTLNCPGSGFKNSECSFSLPHGEIDVTAQSAVAAATTPYNLLVTAEDTGTFNGEGVGLVTIPVGATANNAPVPIFVPASATPTGTPTTAADQAWLASDNAAKATPSPTPTTVFIGAPPAYDMFASVQDLFGAAPQKNSGHEIAVLSGVPPPFDCQTSVTTPAAPAATFSPVACVGHGSVSGTAQSPDQNTLMVISKASDSGSLVDLMTTTVIPSGQQAGGAFAVCAPADPLAYTITHVEAQPTGTPIPGAAVVTTLATPVLLTPPATPQPTPTTPPCNGICSDFSASNNGKSCLLCQATGSIPNPF